MTRNTHIEIHDDVCFSIFKKLVEKEKPWPEKGSRQDFPRVLNKEGTLLSFGVKLLKEYTDSLDGNRMLCVSVGRRAL